MFLLKYEMQQANTQYENVLNNDVDVNTEDKFLVPSLINCTQRRSSTEIAYNNREILDFLDDRDKNLSMLDKYPRISKIF